MSDDLDDLVRKRASTNLQLNAASAIGLGLLQFLCNPCFVTTFMCAGASMNAIKQPKWMEISLEEDYPKHAGQVSTFGGYLGLGLCAVRVGLQVVVMGFQLS